MPPLPLHFYRRSNTNMPVMTFADRGQFLRTMAVRTTYPPIAAPVLEDDRQIAENPALGRVDPHLIGELARIAIPAMMVRAHERLDVTVGLQRPDASVRSSHVSCGRT